MVQINLDYRLYIRYVTGDANWRSIAVQWHIEITSYNVNFETNLCYMANLMILLQKCNIFSLLGEYKLYSNSYFNITGTIISIANCKTRTSVQNEIEKNWCSENRNEILGI